ncbi:hypothetical protein, partial [Nocardia brasiliensis]|uniref:hypothetical protein n=1 Tax=Nocardia brasiliensis TaxID=37326 RepID=UPI003CC7F0CA
MSKVRYPSNIWTDTEKQILLLAVRGYSPERIGEKLSVEHAMVSHRLTYIRSLFDIEIDIENRWFGSALKKYAVVRGALTNGDLAAIQEIAPPLLFKPIELTILLTLQADPSITLSAIFRLHRGTIRDLGSPRYVSVTLRRIARRYGIEFEVAEAIGEGRVREILSAVENDLMASVSEARSRGVGSAVFPSEGVTSGLGGGAARGDGSAVFPVLGEAPTPGSTNTFPEGHQLPGSANRPRIGLAPTAASSAASDSILVDAGLPGTNTEVTADKQPNGPPAVASTDGSTPHTAADNESGPPGPEVPGYESQLAPSESSAPDGYVGALAQHLGGGATEAEAGVVSEIETEAAESFSVSEPEEAADYFAGPDPEAAAIAAQAQRLAAAEPEETTATFEDRTRTVHNSDEFLPGVDSSALPDEQVRTDGLDHTDDMDGVVFADRTGAGGVSVADDFSVDGMRSVGSLEQLFSQVEMDVLL